MKRLSLTSSRKSREKHSPRLGIKIHKTPARHEVDPELLAAIKGKSIESFRRWLFQKKALDLLKYYDSGNDKLSIMGFCVLHGFTAGISTVISENKGTLEALCAELGSKIYQDTQMSGFTPLGFAIECKSLTVAKLLISKGAKINKKFGATTDDAMDEVGIGDLGIVTQSGVSPLGYAIEVGDFEMAQLLLAKGAHLEAKFAVKLTRETPLEFALSINRFGIAELLIDKGAKTTSITSLDLSHADVSAVPVFFAKLKHLKHLKLNPKILATVPPSIKKKGEREILHYFRDLLTDSQIRWRSAKVMVLGKEGVGKTHLTRRLRGKSYGKNMSTDGIDVVSMKFRGMDLTWFDFGGQEVYYPTHQFFLTSQCIYLVVFNLDDPEFRARVMYWLRTVANYTQDPTRPSKIVVVGTHLDSVDEARVQHVWKELGPLLEANGNIIGYVAVSCSDGTGFDVLETGMERALELGNLGALMVPKAYRSIELWLLDARKTTPKIRFDELLQVFPSLKERTVRQALEFLHDMGVCLFFESLNLVITDPQWLANTFSTLITFSHNWVKDGVVAQSDLCHVWKNTPQDEILQIMLLLKRFEVAFMKREEGLWIIPSMLKEERVSTPIDLTSPRWADRYQRQYRLDILPLGLFGRLVARIQEWDVTIVEVWLRGIQIKTDAEVADVVVSLSGEHQCIVVSTVSHVKLVKERSLMQRLAEECNSLFDAAFPARNGLDRPLQQFVVCRHCLENAVKPPTCLPFEQCVEMIMSNQRTFSCGSFQVPVAMIGDDITFSYVDLFKPNQCRVADKPFASGGFGNIFMCQLDGGGGDDGARPRDAVVKELKAENLAQGFGEFQHEVSLMSRLKHPNIVQLYGIMLNPLRMVLEFCAEGDLLVAIEKGRIKNPELKLKLGREIAQGMHFLHSQNPPLAHRDLRSPNILLHNLQLGAEPSAKVSDFGLTVSVTEKVRDPLNAWQWMAPEAQMGDDYSEKCDLYSYAVVLWEIFAEQFPFAEFEKMKQMRLFRALREEGLRPTVPKDIPKYVASLIRRMWSSDPQKRPSFAQAVETFQQQKIAKVNIALDTHCSVKSKIARRELRKVGGDHQFDAPLCMTLAGEQLWTGFRGGDVAAFHAASGELIRRDVRVHREHVLCICRVPFRNRVWTGGRDSKLLEWPLDAWDEELEPEKRPKPSPHRTVESKNDGEITCMAALDGKMIVGDSRGNLCVYEASGTFVTKYTMAGGAQQPVTALVAGVGHENVCWFGSGCDLYKATLTSANTLVVAVIAEKAHDRFILCMVNAGKEVWSVHSGGHGLRVWNVKTEAMRYNVPLPKPKAHIHSMTIVNLRGEPVIWIGSDDEMVLYDVKRRQATRTIVALTEGDVLCLAQTGMNCVWAGMRQKNDHGSFTEVNLN